MFAAGHVSQLILSGEQHIVLVTVPSGLLGLTVNGQRITS